ncbi:MAG: 4'-phosphopantetheinyl transferase superfamily protein [Dysgonamonadaceae bacterium]|jgi:phosphopantetheinyl transferase|nr:4'-phosphopantetheinyl transferase superfamily protein [Dysgonamonadaceae bacterium]
MIFAESVSDTLIWGIREIRGSSVAMLDLLENKTLYLPTLQKMKSEQRKREWLSVRLLLKELLGEEKAIAYTPAGKPHLTDSSYHIGISHSRNHAAVILGKQFPVGIDIESVSPRVHQISARFMSEAESQHLSTDNETIHLLLHWSAKECMFKTMDETGIDFRAHLHVAPFEPVMNRLSFFEAHETLTEQRQSFRMNYIATTDYVVVFTEKRPI